MDHESKSVTVYVGDLQVELILLMREVTNERFDRPTLEAAMEGAWSQFVREYPVAERIFDLHLMIGVLEAFVSVPASDVSRHRTHLSRLAATLHQRAMRAGEPADDDRSLEILQRLVDEIPAGDPDRPRYVLELAVARARHAAAGHDIEALAEAVHRLRMARRGLEQTSPPADDGTADLAQTLYDRARATRGRADLDEAIALLEGLAPPADDGGGTAEDKRLITLGRCFLLRHELDGPLDDLERGCQVLELARGNTAAASRNRRLCLLDLASGLGRLVVARPEVDMLDRLAAVVKELLESAPDEAAQCNALRTLTATLERLSAADRDGGKLARGLIDVYAAPTTHIADRGECWLQCQHNIAAARRLLYLSTGDVDDLNTAIEILDGALKDTTDAGEGRRDALVLLGAALRDRCMHGHGEADLARAIECYETVMAEAARDSIAPPADIGINLSLALRDRYILHGSLRDLDRAIEIAEAGQGLPGLSGERRGVWLNMIGLARRERFVQSNNPADLAAAIDAHEAGTKLAANPILQAVLQSNLGGEYVMRFALTGDSADLTRSVEALERAIEITSVTAPDRPRYLMHLAETLKRRYERERRFADLDRAVDLTDQALARLPSDSIDRAVGLVLLAVLSGMRYEQLGRRADLERARTTYRSASCATSGRLVVRSLHNAVSWAGWAERRGAWDEAAEAGAAAVDAMLHLSRTQIGRSDKESWLEVGWHVPSSAAYAMAASGQPLAAVTSLERSRTVLLTEALQRDRAELAALSAAGHGGLVDRYRAALERRTHVARRIELGPAASAGGALSGYQLDVDGDRLLDAANKEVEDAILAIRAIPGYGRLFDVVTFEDVRRASLDSPIVYIIAGDPGGVALIVDRAGVTTVWLPYLTRHAVHARLDTLSEAYGDRHAQRGRWLGRLDATARWLWRAAMSDIVDALDPNGAAVLIPCGMLAMLPLHAAWVPDPGLPTGRRYASDILHLTYSPSATSLLTARQAAAHSSDAGFLAVCEPRPSGLRPLTYAAPEVAFATAWFTDARNLSGDAATVEAVVSALHSYSAHHFACHGVAFASDPLDSAILLAHDERLTLGRLLDRSMEWEAGRPSRLFVLSACEMQVPGQRLPDEVISFPSGLLQAGTAGIIAPQWAVPDVATATLMAHFYSTWRQDRLAPSAALRAAQRWLRDSTNQEKMHWLRQVGDQSGDRSLRDAARALRRAAARRPPDERSCAHIADWAAFTYIGA